MNTFQISLFTKTGLSHMDGDRIIKPCEDAVSHASGRAGRVEVITLSDGCGNAPHAMEGAQTASAVAAEFVSDQFDELCEMSSYEREETILLEVRKALFKEAIKLNADISQFSCTLLIAALRDDGKGLYFHIGDGLIYSRRSDGSIELVSRYKHKYSNVTSFVTSVKTNCRTDLCNDTTSFLLTSDGSESFLLNRSRSSADLFVKLSHILPQERMYSEFSSFTDKITRLGAFDDISFITLSKNQEISDVFDELFCQSSSSAALRSAIFGGIKKRTAIRYAELIRLLAGSENGADIRSINKIMRSHSLRYARRRIEPLIRQGIIVYSNGRFYLDR